MSHIQVESRTFQCECGHVFEYEILLHIDVSVFIFHLRKIHCPKCGAGHRKVFFYDPASASSVA